MLYSVLLPPVIGLKVTVSSYMCIDGEDKATYPWLQSNFAIHLLRSSYMRWRWWGLWRWLSLLGWWWCGGCCSCSRKCLLTSVPGVIDWGWGAGLRWPHQFAESDHLAGQHLNVLWTRHKMQYKQWLTNVRCWWKEGTDLSGLQLNKFGTHTQDQSNISTLQVFRRIHKYCFIIICAFSVKRTAFYKYQ